MLGMTQGTVDLTAATSSDDPLARGDDAAEREDWPAAVSDWRRALSSAQREDAIARLEWFIAWRTDRPAKQASERPYRKPIELFLGFLACCLFAVAAVLVTEDLTGTPAVLSMIAAWVFIVAAAVLSLLYARYSEPEPSNAPRLGERQVRSLAERATRLAGQPGHADEPD
jgi:hypothetical protein